MECVLDYAVHRSHRHCANSLTIMCSDTSYSISELKYHSCGPLFHHRLPPSPIHAMEGYQSCAMEHAVLVLSFWTWPLANRGFFHRNFLFLCGALILVAFSLQSHVHHGRRRSRSRHQPRWGPTRHSSHTLVRHTSPLRTALTAQPVSPSW